MKTILKSALLAAALSGTSLMAEVVFDLGNQQFYYPSSRTSSGNFIYKEASYDVGTAIVSTGLTSKYGYYEPINGGSGHFGVRIKNPEENWAVILNMSAYLYADGFSIQLQGEDSNTLGVSFSKGNVSVDGTTKSDNYFSNRIDISVRIQTIGNQVKVIVNDRLTFLLNKPNFRLAKFDVVLNSELDVSYGRRGDRLNSLTISTND